MCDHVPLLRLAIHACFSAGLDVLVIGRGSNCLFDDRGFDGLVGAVRTEGGSDLQCSMMPLSPFYSNAVKSYC